MLMVFNPLDEPVEKELKVPLYYTGLKESARFISEDGLIQTRQLQRDYSTTLKVQMKPQSAAWFLVQ
jgi:hypothetical protein